MFGVLCFFWGGMRAWVCERRSAGLPTPACRPRLSFQTAHPAPSPHRPVTRAARRQDVLVTLLNNLKVQERQNRVCTTVAIAIVAETCQPFTVLPALMNEYRTPELNVQNGVLKVCLGRARARACVCVCVFTHTLLYARARVCVCV